MNALGASVRHRDVTFSAWAPRCRALDLVIDGRPARPMSPTGDGMFETVVENLSAGTRYQYRLDGERYRPVIQTSGHCE